MVTSGGIIKRKVFLGAWIILCMLLNAVMLQSVEEKGLSACELESLVRQILNPNPEYQMHANALRDQLRTMIQSKSSDIPFQSIDEAPDYFDEDKRISVNALARGGKITYGKRYLGALAKSGMMLRSSNYDDIKRSVATLAKNGQLPTQEPDTIYDDSQQQQWEEKRNLGSLAKSGGIGTGKRNIGTLARDFQLPSHGKRNLAALARMGLAPKRNIASLARQNSYYMAEKKNIAALKNSPVHGQRQKRDVYGGDLGDYEIPDEVIQNYSDDYYDDLKNQLNQLYGGPYEEKRFLGSVAKSGSLRPSAEKRNIGSLARLGLLRSFDGGSYGFHQPEQKRHIGALARSGWLSAFRPVRSARFSRSGRARSDITPNKSDYYNPPRPFVDDVISSIKTTQTQLAGNPQHHLVQQHHQRDYLDGVPHQDLQHYTGEVYDPHLITEQLKFINNNNNNNKNNINDNNNNNNNDKQNNNDEFLNYLINLSEINNNKNSNKDNFNINHNNYYYNKKNRDEIECSQRLNLMLDTLNKY